MKTLLPMFEPAPVLSGVRIVPGSVGVAIAGVVADTAPGKGRVKALKAVRWVMRSGSFYVGPVSRETLECPLVRSLDEAAVYDGRDNETLKARFFASVFGAAFEPVLVEALATPA